MNFKRSIHIMILFYLFISACSGPPEKKEIILSGNIGPISITDSYSQPIFVMVAKGNDMDLIQDDPTEYIITTVSVDLSTYSFRINLTDKNVNVGDEIFVFAFVDRDYANGMPYPSLNDIVGFYFNEDKLSATYILKEGENNGLEIELNRNVYSFDANVLGSVNDALVGDLTIIAYAGEIISSDTTALDYDAVIGYKFFDKGEAPVEFDMSILPYGFDVPIENVYLFSFLDVNRNGEADGGDKVGYYTSPEDEYPTAITINEGTVEGFEIEYAMDITDPSGFNISLEGNLVLPDEAQNVSAPSYIIVAETDNPDDLMEDPVSAIKYFEKIPAGQTSFDIDLSNTDLMPEDEIMIVALWDKDNKGGFPEPTEKDFIGFYMDTEDLAVTYLLKEGANEGIEIEINREVFTYDAEIRGTVKGSEEGELLIIAYAGEITSLDMDVLDYDKVIAYREYIKESSDLDFKLNVLPYGENIPIENVSLYAVLDQNGNGKPDSGDLLGYHTSRSDNMPELLTINEGVTENADIKLLMEIATPSGFEMSIEGELDFSQPDDSPVYIIVAQSDDPAKMLDDPTSSIKYFEKIGKGATHFKIDLSSTDLVPGDEVMVVALLDKDNRGGFPNPTDGDYLGFYLDTDTLSLTYPLADGENIGINIDVDREVFSFEAEIQGRVEGDQEGDILLIAYAGELNSLDFNELDYSKVIGYQEYTKTSEPLSYFMSILPYGVDVPIENMYVFAFLDKNGNGKPDMGDMIGYPVDSESNMPELVSVTAEGIKTGINIEMSYTIPEPSGYDMSLSGRFEKPSGYTGSSGPVFIVVTMADNIDAIFDDPISSIKAFQKLTKGENSFDIDLSETDLVPGDDVMVLALWDKNYKGGFPNPDAGDLAGFYLNREEFLISVTLQEGINTIQPEGEYDFNINRILYDTEASVSFEFHDGDLPARLDDNGDGDKLDPGDKILLVLIQEMGLNNGRLITNPNMDIEIDYVIGMETITVNADNLYSVNVLPAIFEDIEVNNFIDDVYILAILDENDNGTPDEGEYIGYYWRSWWDTLFLYQPATVDLNSGANRLSRSVRFTNFKY